MDPFVQPDPPRALSIGLPHPCNTAKSHGQFRFQLLLRSSSPRTLSRHVQKILAQTTLPDEVHVIFDMDAYDFE